MRESQERARVGLQPESADTAQPSPDNFGALVEVARGVHDSQRSERVDSPARWLRHIRLDAERDLLTSLRDGARLGRLPVKVGSDVAAG
jgi:hypothetical protein